MRSIALGMVLVCLLAGAVVAPGAAPARASAPGSGPQHGLSMHGDLKYPPGFTHFEYVNPQAPRGGLVRLSALGTFDTFHPFVLKGVPPAGIGNTFDTLTVNAGDEPFSEYGLVAETIETPPDRSWVAFTLRSQARFHDGSPITVDDVIWTFETLRKQGRPFFRAYYAHVTRAEQVGPRTVRFTFRGAANRELPLILGQMPVLPKAYWGGRDFTQTTLQPPLGSGPYRVTSFEPGRSITYERVRDYWAADLPVMVGRHNFDVMRFDYYRDGTVALEAFKGGAYDFRAENSAKNWATAYDFPALSQGRVRREAIPHEIPTGMQAWVYNTRRPMFQDPRVRWALAHAFDFEWANTALFYGAYTRTRSYFSNSELASRGVPGPLELEVLEPLRARVPHEVFTREYRPPVAAGPEGRRQNLLTAMRQLEGAGWVVRDRRLVHAETGQPMTFEILLSDPGFERIALPFRRNLQRLGIDARVRTVDTAQYRFRLDRFDFDMVVGSWGQSLSPGNEQEDYWGSERADEPGSRNLAGIRDPAVDRLVEALIAAPDRERLVARTRALDRVLLWSHYVIPQWHIPAFRVAYWDKFERPAVSPKYELGFDTWWVRP